MFIRLTSFKKYPTEHKFKRFIKETAVLAGSIREIR